jgi:hypothetical protein
MAESAVPRYCPFLVRNPLFVSVAAPAIWLAVMNTGSVWFFVAKGCYQ